MLPNLTNMDAQSINLQTTKSQNAKTYPTIRRIYDELVSTETLDFEYLTQLGDEDLNKRIFDAMFGSSVDCKPLFALSQTCGLQNGHFIMSYIVNSYYENSGRFFVKTQNPVLDVLLKGYKFETESLNLEDLANMPNSGVIVIDNPTSKELEVLNNNIETLNSKGILVIIDMDHLDDFKDLAFNDRLSKTMKQLVDVMNNLEAVAINVDLTRYLKISGTNIGHLFVKIDSEENARNAEGAIAFCNRNTFSTPVKLGCFIWHRLLSSPDHLKTLGDELNA